jgi:hypothetical protein
MLPMHPRIYVERQQNAWTVQELDAPPSNLRFRIKRWAVVEGEREARRRQAELVVLDCRGRITRWQSFTGHEFRNQEWIGQDLQTG